MNIVIRADSSIEIGSGHIMRCLTLADQLVADGAKVGFVCRQLPGAMIDAIRQRGHSCMLVRPDGEDARNDAAATHAAIGAAEDFSVSVDWLVVDHYGLDAEWEELMRPFVRNIMVIDDLANRPHDCDLLLDQNFYEGFESRYERLLPDSARCLLGPVHVLLRPEFSDARRTLRRRDGSVGRILVFFGGSDPTNQTQRVLEGIDTLRRPDICVDVVVGSANPHREGVRAFCEARPWASFHCQISNMAELIAAADLGVGAGGAAMWERCALGLPTVTVVFADNQVQTTRDVAQTGAIAYLGWASELSSVDYADAIRGLLDRPDDLGAVASKALALVDTSNNGVASVIRTMNEITSMKVSC